MPERRPPIWLWPNLLSLDAPLVAVAWLYMFAEAWRVNYLPTLAYLGLGLSVWVIYVLDRLLDVRLHGADDSRLGRRHRFHARHRGWFLAGVAVSLGVIGWIVFGVLPIELLLSYSVPAAVLVGGTFAMGLATSASRETPLLRNLLAGLAFSYGTAMIAHTYVPTEGAFQLLFSREMLAFGVLCVLNISAIHLWEHAERAGDPEVAAADELSLTLPLILLAACALAFAYLDNPGMFGRAVGGSEPRARPFFYAVLISSALLYLVNRWRRRFSMDGLRGLADLAMIVPLPLFLLLTAG